MKVRNKLLLLIIVCLLSFVLIVQFFNTTITEKSHDLIQQRYEESKVELSKTLEFSVQGMRNYAFDNTVWDEMAEYVQGQKDNEWLSENLISVAPKVGAKYVLIANAKFNILYSSDILADTADNFTLNTETLKKIAKAKHDVVFNLLHKKQLLRVVLSPIHYSVDNNRLKNPVGYLAIAEVIDNQKLKDWEQLMQYTTLSFEPITSDKKDNNPDINFTKGEIIFTKTFYNPDNEPIATIRINKSSSIYSQFYGYFNRYLYLFVLCCVVLLLALFFFFTRWVNIPLINISRALKSNNAAYIKTLADSDTEFAELSNIITNSFHQKLLLENEIETRKKSEEALLHALEEVKEANIKRDRAEQADLAKSLFLSTMSHEIRTPINGVIGIAHLLLAESPTASQERYLKLLEFSAKHLKSLVDDILDFSKIESGKIEFTKQSFNLGSLINDIYLTHQLRALEKKIEIKIEHDPTIKNYLIGDNIRLNQIITNVFSNAIKFTEQGFVLLKYTVSDATDKEIIIQFTIQDSGIGISEEQLDTVFNHFTQANMDINRKYGGTGLGLAISKKLVEMQGGTITVDSKLGLGSAFNIALKFQLGGIIAENTNNQKGNLNLKDLNKMNVLVVEDNNINAFVVKQFLTKWNVGRLDFAMNGEEAWQKVNEVEYDIVLMDLQMPIVDGYEATSRIRNSENLKLKLLPIIALSADASADTKDRIKRFGFNSYITKPFDPDELFKEMLKTTMH